MIRAILYGVVLGGIMGLVFEAIFFHLAWNTVFWGLGFGMAGGFIVGVTDGIAALAMFSHRFSNIPTISKYHSRFNGVLLLATVITTAILYISFFSLISGNSVNRLYFHDPNYLSCLNMFINRKSPIRETVHTYCLEQS